MPTPLDDVDFSNKFMLGARGDDAIVFLVAPVPRVISSDDALVLAAWLVTLADPSIGETRFRYLLDKVQST